MPRRVMTRDPVETALHEAILFQIKMADREKYDVTEQYQVALGKTTVVVVDSAGIPHVLPLLTMTGISHQTAAGGEVEGPLA